MEKMLDDLLIYSRVGRHYYNNKESFNTGVLVEEVIDLLAPPARFTIVVQEMMPALTTYRVLLEMVFKNLIENAIKYHDRPDGRIEISAREVDGFIEFSVADDGPGINEAFHERIFQIFQTLRPKDEIGGSGLGLAIVKKAVEGQGGAISVISKEGQGTTFRFTWPKEIQ
jgi:signal transduction histidine kinase